MKTTLVKPAELERKWFVVDAEGKTLGRLASQIAGILRGKHKPEFSPFQDNGDYVIVINAEKVHVTGNKEDKKVYFRHSQYIGGVKTQTLGEMLKKHPERAIYYAVEGMLPHNALGRKMIKKLKVYAGSEHPHVAQKAETLDLA